MEVEAEAAKGRTMSSRTPATKTANPADTDLIKVLGTIAWPRAVNHILGRAVFPTVQARHDKLMNEWVAARGNDIPSDAYDYFMYSYFVFWSKGVLENATKTNLTKFNYPSDEHLTEYTMDVLRKQSIRTAALGRQKAGI
ncbi:hypothetical protein BDZ97DRAFT_1761501 [Flammula alnicola]|nr:hypothetical protein BDZ97DRAFT_1761501 [Flammula alnicola]